MGYVKLTEYKGKKIIEMNFRDYAYKDIPEIKKIMDDTKVLIESQPLESAYTMTDVIGLRFSSEIIEMFKEFADHNKSFVKVGAVVGIVGLQKLAYDAVMRFTKRNIPAFPTREEALEWLVQQE